MRLTITAIASYTQGLSKEDIEAIEEDIHDCLRWTGIVNGGSGIIVESKVDQ